MNVIGVAWDVVKCEVNPTSWYVCKHVESCFFFWVIACLLVIYSLHDLVPW